MDTRTILILVILWSCVLPLLIGDATACGAAKIVEQRKGRNRTADYFVAGMCAQPREAFSFMFDLPMLEYDTLKLVPYSNRRVNFAKITEAILQDAVDHKYQKVRIFAISVGASVAHLAGKQKAAGKAPGNFELECYLISPCQSAQFLKPKLRTRLTRTYPLMVVLLMVMGPLAFVPMVPASGSYFSLALVINQVERILSHPTVSLSHRQYVKGIILSDKDEFLDNQSIHAFYAQRSILYVRNVAHARTIDAADKYRSTMERLLKILAP